MKLFQFHELKKSKIEILLQFWAGFLCISLFFQLESPKGVDIKSPGQNLLSGMSLAFQRKALCVFAVLHKLFPLDKSLSVKTQTPAQE